MNDLQENKLKMYFAVQQVLHNHTKVFKNLKAFVNVFTQFGNTLKEIQNTRLIEEGKLTGISQDKAQAKKEATNKAMEIAATVFAYASSTTNNTLKDKINYSATDLRRSRDTILLDQLHVIHDTAKDELANLGDYGLEVNDLTKLLALISAFEQLMYEPRVALTDRVQATAQLVVLFLRGDKLLKEQLDKLMVLYKTTEATFYHKYTGARKIIDLGVRHQTKE